MRFLTLVLMLHVVASASMIGEPKADPREVRVKHYNMNMGITAISRLPTDREIWTQRAVILDSLLIPAGDSLVIKSPTTVMFERAGAMIVEGTLIVRGTSERPVVFTAMPYSKSYEYVFDESRKDTLWDGIILRGGGSLRIDTAIISKATSGLRCEGRQRKFTVQCLSFRDIAQGIPDVFPTGTDGDADCIDFTTYSSGRAQSVPGIGPPSPQRSFTGPAALLSAGVGAAGLAGFLVFRHLTEKAEAEATVEPEVRRAYQLRDRRDAFLTTRNCSAVVGMAGGTGLMVFGFMWIKKF